MATPGIGVSAFNDLDACFHVLHARSSGNALTSTLTSAVPESVRPLILRWKMPRTGPPPPALSTRSTVCF